MARRVWIAGGLVAAAATPATAAVSLSSLNAPTVQTLIDLGDAGVIVGDERYSDFTYVGGIGAPAADAVRVQGVGGTAGPSGLRFVAGWTASGGGSTTSTWSYTVEPVASTDDVARLTLTSNGTAPSPAAGTFATATLLAETADPAAEPVPAAPLLATFDDGRTVPSDTTATDVDAASAALSPPQSALSVTDSVIVASGRTGGVATASVVQNVFTPTAVPEPTGLVAVVVTLWAARRRPR